MWFRSKSPEPCGLRVKLSGDHAHYHCGSAAVVDYLHGQIKAAGCVLVEDDTYDALIVNGEGSMHHNSPACLAKLTEMKAAVMAGKKVFLVNSVWQENPGADPELLRSLSAVYFRESESQSDYTRNYGFPSKVRIDVSYWAPVGKVEEHTDYNGREICTDFYANDCGCFIRINSGPISRLPCVDMKAMSWSQLVSSIKTSRLLVTGRHHAVFAACRAEVPFVAVAGNTHKIEGFVGMSGIPLPICKQVRDLAEGLKWARENPSAYKEFFAWLREQPPLRFAEFI